MKSLVIIILALFLSITRVSAQEKEFSLDTLEYNSFFENAPNPIDVSVLEKFAIQGMNFVYLGETNSMDNWLSIKDGGLQILSTTLDGKALVFGAVYDKDGENRTLANIEKIFPNVGEALYAFSQKSVRDSIDFELEFFKQKNQQMVAKYTKQEEQKESGVDKAIWDSLEQTNYVEKGNPNAPVIYLFSDIYCGHCNSLSKNLKPYVDRNIIRIRYIPVGVLSKQSVLAALGILSSVNVNAAWTDYYDNGNDRILQTPPTEEGMKKLEINLEVFDRWKLKGTPSMFYKTKSGEVKFLYGQPETIGGFINDVTK